MSGDRLPAAAVVLAAGFSRRLGRPKQEILLDGETLLERAARVALEAGLAPVILVVAAETALTDRLKERGCRIAVNEKAAEGMASSIRCGSSIAQATGAAGVVLMTCDQVLLRTEHLRALCERPERRTGSGYAGKIGVPAYFPASDYAALLQLEGDSGARDLLRTASAVVAEELAVDIDTEADLGRLLAVYPPPPVSA